MIPTDQYFPHLAQGIAVSDEMIKEKPEMIRKFVTAAMRGMKDVMDDPDKAAEDFVTFVPDMEGQGRRRQVRASTCTPSRSISTRSSSARSMPTRLAKLQDFYLAKGFIQKTTPVDELYTNEFIK